MPNKVVVFDFDKTLTYKDTVFPFFLDVSRKGIPFFFKVPLFFFCMVLFKLKLISNSTLKRIGVYFFLRNQRLSLLKEKSREFADKIKFNELFMTYDFSDPSEDIYIISASFEIYLKEIFQESVKIIGSDLTIKNGIVQCLGSNCFGERKVELLKEENIEKIDMLYTDSLSDLPLAKISSDIIVVSGDNLRKCKNYSDFINVLK